MIDSDSVVVPVRRLAFRRIGEQVVLVCPDDNIMLTLNPTGSVVWEALDGQRSVKQIASVVSEEFEVTSDEAQKDVVTFLEMMIGRELVEVEGAGK